MAEQQNILVILGHPAADSLCAGMAHAYAQGAQHAGAQVRFLDVGQLAFNPLFRGYGAAAPLEPDLLAAVPTYFTGGLWWLAYTVVGLALPLAGDLVYKKVREAFPFGGRWPKAG